MGTRCANCGAADGLGEVDRKAVPYRGLPGTVLLGMETQTCRACGDESVLYPRMEELHRVLLHAVAHKPGRLTGAEIRFLRSCLGWSGTELARHFATDKATVSRWETGGQRMDERAELLLRVVATRLEPMEEVTELEELLARLQQPEVTGERHLRFTPEVGWSVETVEAQPGIEARP